ncbi:MAG: hypothetical protein KDH09_07260 [Chrysiogenetes bacterium]|nr:hypothetical protein [Chrysiogenetes bacterium]
MRFLAILVLSALLASIHAGRVDAQEAPVCLIEIQKQLADDFGALTRRISNSNENNWGAFYSIYRDIALYHCDDGWMGEGASDTAVQLFAKDWQHVSDFLELQRTHKDFDVFVWGHIDATVSPDDLWQIHENTTANCPKGHEKFCSELLIRAGQAFAEVWEGLSPCKDETIGDGPGNPGNLFSCVWLIEASGRTDLIHQYMDVALSRRESAWEQEDLALAMIYASVPTAFDRELSKFAKDDQRTLFRRLEFGWANFAYMNPEKQASLTSSVSQIGKRVLDDPDYDFSQMLKNRLK